MLLGILLIVAHSQMSDAAREVGSMTSMTGHLRYLRLSSFIVQLSTQTLGVLASMIVRLNCSPTSLLTLFRHRDQRLARRYPASVLYIYGDHDRIEEQ